MWPRTSVFPHDDFVHSDDFLFDVARAVLYPGNQPVILLQVWLGTLALCKVDFSGFRTRVPSPGAAVAFLNRVLSVASPLCWRVAFDVPGLVLTTSAEMAFVLVWLGSLEPSPFDPLTVMFPLVYLSQNRKCRTYLVPC